MESRVRGCLLMAVGLRGRGRNCWTASIWRWDEPESRVGSFLAYFLNTGSVTKLGVY